MGATEVKCLQKEYSHFPPLHFVTAFGISLHFVPQAPQLFVSVPVLDSHPLVQSPSQLLNPGLHEYSHLPPLHFVTAFGISLHFVPQAPQLFVSVPVLDSHPLVQSPSQLLNPGLHEYSHLPPLHFVTAFGISLHFVPQAPQLLVSVPVLDSQPLVQSPSQLLNPGLQEYSHFPPLHFVTAFGISLHFVPQAPQLFVSVPVLDSHPLVQSPSQLLNPGLHEYSHLPPLHFVTAFGISLHFVPQAPQLFVSVPVLDSHPLVQSPSQLLNPGLHEYSHLPPLHFVTAFGISLHFVPQAPQLFVSVPVLDSHPLVQSPSQLLNPGLHEYSHLPPLHFVTAFGISLHFVPQAPQLLVSVPVLDSQPFAGFMSQSA
ncbi:hypothetical protein KC19_2G062200 [Ceratodon purpureus]|uniref:Uncharacterized protein n=1 Tax=Ceratodon purpureus TaxID=3225 RepID=A0A8T0ITT9_CERPU|nr:hypothetical protein KC19_2G062200 [Ceratodon purpureus]